MMNPSPSETFNTELKPAVPKLNEIMHNILYTVLVSALESVQQ